MSLLTLFDEIGDDADLLARSDAWLEMERQARTSELDRITNELRAILLAQKIKTTLQQKNLVATQQILRDDVGNIRDIVIRILSLPDALAAISRSRDTLDDLNMIGQLCCWQSDGYDLTNQVTSQVS